MSKVQPIPVPPGSFLDAYAQQNGVYTDCFCVTVAADIAFADYIEAFYTTPLFKAERLMLHLFAKAPSQDAQARLLGLGQLDRFAVWRVGERAENQLLMRTNGRTSSWFMIDVQGDDTRLMFGSVVLPETDRHTGAKTTGFVFNALLGAHRIYSRLLLSAARRRLLRSR